MKNKYIIPLLFLLIITTEGCMVGKQYSRPQLQLPDVYSDSAATDTLPLVKWFNLFNDTVLQRLITTTLQSNKDLLTATARIDEARYEVSSIRTNQYPSIGYNLLGGGGQAGRDAQKVAGGIDGGIIKTFGVVNWEPDLWGRLRRLNKTAQASFLAETENRNAIQASLVAQVASLYFLLGDLDNRLTIAQRTLISRKESTRINSEKFNKGYTAELDKLQAMQQEATAAAAIPNFQRQIVQTENAIRVLMGMAPGHIGRGALLYDQHLPIEIPAGLPSQLLERRPDIRFAEQKLQAQFEQIGIAQTNLYPRLTLTGILGFASPQLSSLLSSGGFVANGLGELLGPIFQFRRNKLKVEIEKKRTEEIGYQYEQSVLQAMAEVDNALVACRTYNEEYVIRRNQVEASVKALMLTKARYDYGYTSYLEVLIQENSLFDAELQASFTYQQKLNALITLYKALGGGWEL